MSGGGGKGGKGSWEVIDYRMSLQWGVCADRVDKVKGIYLQDRLIPITGEPASNQVQTLDAMELFGGPKKGGGVKGDIHFLFGDTTQQMSDTLAVKHGRTPSTMTGHRGFLSLFFTAIGNATNGFIWGTNNPAIPAPEVIVERQPKTLPGYAGGIGEDANPAAIIHECMRNTEWGAGYSQDAIHGATFLTAAQTLQDEGFGLSFEWDAQGPVEDFVNNVLRHINARINFDMERGQWQLFLLRDDYDEGSVPVISRRNARLKEYQRKTWADVVGNLVVTFTNPENEEQETVTLYDSAAMSIQSTEVRDNDAQYPGVRNFELAWKVVERDLRQKSALLASATVETPYALDGVRPGQVVLLDWTDEPMNGESDFQLQDKIVMRVMSVRASERGSAKQVVSLMEDIFSYGAAPRGFDAPVTLGTSEIPQDAQNYQISGAPFYVVARALGDGDARSISYPRTATMVLADTGGSDVRDIDLRRLVTENGSSWYRSVDIIDDQVSFQIDSQLDAVASSTIADATQIAGLSVGDFLQIGTAPNDEIMVITAIDSNLASFTVGRGVLDTIPRQWPTGTQVFGVARDSNVLDHSEHSTGEALRYKLLPTTSRGALPLADATERLFTASDRMHLPHRPSNLSFNGVSGFTFNIDQAIANWTFNWSNRNRITETGAVLLWDDATVQPENAQGLSLVFRRNGTVVHTQNFTGSSLTTYTHNFNINDKAPGDVFTVEFIASRDGYNAYQVPTISITID